MAPLYGWGVKGKRLKGLAPHGHWRTLTFLGALRADRLVAPCVFNGPINGQSFRAYVEQQLVATLKPGDIVIMDNLGSHKSAAVRDLIRKAGARLWYLPPYSPDLNPIEQVFAKIKHWMRQEQKRTIEDTWRHIGVLVDTIGPQECSNYLANAGYASIKTGNALATDRDKVHPNRHLNGWTGILQADAYGGYNDLYREDRKPGPVVSALCWSRARRKFFELADIAGNVRKGKPVHAISPVALAAVTRMDALFAIERDINGLDAEARREARQRLSHPLACRKWMDIAPTRRWPSGGAKATLVRFGLPSVWRMRGASSSRWSRRRGQARRWRSSH